MTAGGFALWRRFLKKADLVTRQEFEAQRNLLQQAERKLVELEARLKNFKE